MARKIFLLGLLVLLAVVGCGRGTPISTLVNTPIVTVSVPTVTNTPLPGKVVLVAHSRFTGDLGSLENVLSEQASSAGLTYEKRGGLQPTDISAEWKLVLFTVKPDNLNDYLSQAPGTFFVAITSDAVQPAANLSVIHTDPARLAFLAGYITELIAKDWRGAGLLPNDTPYANDVNQAFVNGGQYWCGTCSPQHPPYMNFPIEAGESSSADWTAWQVQANLLLDNRLYVMYVSQQAAKPELLSYLAANDIKLLGETAPSQDILGNWVATLGWNINDVIANHWSEFLSGQPGQVYEAGIALTNVSAELLSAGKLRLVEETAGQLQNGLVSPLSVP